MMNEASSMAVRLVDIDEQTSLDTLTYSLAREISNPDAEQEVILASSGERYVTRLRVEPPPASQPGTAPANLPVLRLGFQSPGLLRNLRWESHAHVPPGDDELEIEVRATGLNFRDVMYALGLLSDGAVENGFAGPSLGLEFAGIVTGVGGRVRGFAAGDRVFGFGPGSFSNRVVTKAGCVSLIPADTAFEAAATIPGAFFTVHYALNHLARLQEGEKILIHGAAGGVGIAAIQFAKWKGAEIFATAGSEEKRDFLRLLGVDHVLDSRSLAFADQILAITEGGGIDVVLNSLAGEAIERNLRILKPFGRFLELGKRDFQENTKIGLRPFRNNISYFGIDADLLMKERPDLTGKLFGELMALFGEGVLQPLPYRCFEAEDIVDAFRYMQQSRHIGKIVVTYKRGIHPVPAPQREKRRLELSTEASYLVTGGLSGFGLKTAQWLASRGARNLVLVGRRGLVEPEARAAVAALQSAGVRVHAAACDVSDAKAISTLLSEIAVILPPLRGIVHAATVIEDGLIRNVSRDQIRRVFAPKILGAQYLHQLTLGKQLDFFILFSSATTLFGNPGQGNYVAANACVEALALLRRAMGLPALCVRWGAIDDAGYLARNPQIKEALQGRMGGSALQSAVALDALEELLLANRSGMGVLELDWKALKRFLPTSASPKFSALAPAAADVNADDEGNQDVQRLLTTLSADELSATFIEMLKTSVGEILRTSPAKIDEHRSLHDMGLDSLMALELRNRLEPRVGITLPAALVWAYPTISDLASALSKLPALQMNGPFALFAPCLEARPEIRRGTTHRWGFKRHFARRTPAKLFLASGLPRRERKIEQLRLAQTKGGETAPMNWTGPVRRQGREMSRGAVSFVFGKSVLRPLQVVIDHQSVPRYLGDHAGGGNRVTTGVAFDQGSVRKSERAHAAAIDQDVLRRGPQLFQGQVHRAVRGLENIDLIDYLEINAGDRPMNLRMRSTKWADGRGPRPWT